MFNLAKVSKALLLIKLTSMGKSWMQGFGGFVAATIKSMASSWLQWLQVHRSYYQIMLVVQ